MSEHTEGPWKVSEGPNHLLVIGRAGEGIIGVATVIDHSQSKETDKANANVLAAAPELLAEGAALLEALEQTLTASGAIAVEINGTWINLSGLRGAIRKARGRSAVPA